MATPNKAKITAIRTYLLNTVDETLQTETKVLTTAQELKHKTLLTKTKAAFKKMSAAQKEFNALADQMRQTVAPINLTLSIPGHSFTHNHNTEITLTPIRNTGMYSSINSGRSWKSYDCTPDQMEKAKEAVKQIDNYCLELVISPDMENLESFAKQIIKALK